MGKWESPADYYSLDKGYLYRSSSVKFSHDFLTWMKHVLLDSLEEIARALEVLKEILRFVQKVVSKPSCHLA